MLSSQLGSDAFGIGGLLDSASGFLTEGADVGFGIVDSFEHAAQIYLDQALRTAIPYTEYFTEKAIDNMNRMFDLAREDARQYYERSQAQTAPYREAGFQALDMLQDTLGIARPSQGSSAMYHAMENKAKEASLRRQRGLEAAATAREMQMDPQQAYNFISTATWGNNPQGLNTALSEYASSTYPRDFGLKATDPMYRDRGKPSAPGPGVEGEVPDPHEFTDITEPNMYNNVLANTYARFSRPQKMVSDFISRSAGTGNDLLAALQNQSSMQRTLANIGTNTGYSHLVPVRRDV